MKIDFKHSKYFYHKCSNSLKQTYSFKYITFTFKNWGNGRAEMFLHFFGYNFILYLNELKESEYKFTKLLNY
jgi:hypothetical protein